MNSSNICTNVKLNDVNLTPRNDARTPPACQPYDVLQTNQLSAKHKPTILFFPEDITSSHNQDTYYNANNDDHNHTVTGKQDQQNKDNYSLNDINKTIHLNGFKGNDDYNTEENKTSMYAGNQNSNHNSNNSSKSHCSSDVTGKVNDDVDILEIDIGEDNGDDNDDDDELSQLHYDSDLSNHHPHHQQTFKRTYHSYSNASSNASNPGNYNTSCEATSFASHFTSSYTHGLPFYRKKSKRLNKTSNNTLTQWLIDHYGNVVYRPCIYIYMYLYADE